MAWIRKKNLFVVSFLIDVGIGDEERFFKLRVMDSWFKVIFLLILTSMHINLLYVFVQSNFRVAG